MRHRVQDEKAQRVIYVIDNGQEWRGTSWESAGGLGKTVLHVYIHLYFIVTYISILLEIRLEWIDRWHPDQ